jgi:SOS response regulatory protein OraA/RecX
MNSRRRPRRPGGRAVRNQALRLLASREHSRRELERKLLARGYEAGRPGGGPG